MSKIDDLFAKKAPEAAHEDVGVVFRGELLTIRGRALGGPEWAEICARNPFRAAVPMDMNYGYNVHGVATGAVPLSCVVVEGDVEVPLDDGKWAVVLKGLSGHDFGVVVDMIFRLNEFGPAELVERLKKASITARKRKRS